MFGDKQGQQVGAGAIAVQAGGNVNIGPSVSEVRELVQLFLQQNFPVLREEARLAAQENVRDFLAMLEQRIGDASQRIDPMHFRDPDVQAMLNDAVQASARRGQAAHPDILCDLVTERISQDREEFRDIVMAEAITVVPKLTSAQISMLVLLHAVLEMRVSQNQSTFLLLEVFGQAVKPYCEKVSGISAGQKSHMQYTGTCSLMTGAFAFEVWGALQQQYSHLGYKNAEGFKTAVSEKAPTYFALVNLFESERLGSATLTSVGRAIALARLTKVFKGLNFDTWIL